MDSKKNNNVFFRILSVFLIVFAVLMVVLKTGYYEAQKREDIVLTDEAIRDYEMKLANKESVNLNSYLNKPVKNYSNNFSRAGEKITNGVEKVMSSGFKTVFGILQTLF